MPGLQIVSSLNLEHMGRSGDGTLLATSTDELLEDGVEVGEELLRRLAGEEGT